MSLLYPEVFWLLILLFLFLVSGLLKYRKGRAMLKVLAGEWRMVQAGRVYFIKTLIEWLTLGLFFIFAVLSLAGISWTQKPVKDESLGLDIMFAVDISRSMTAADMDPSRLTRASETILRLLPSADRSGIVVFKGEGLVLVPMTEDHISVESAADSLSPGMYSVPGSSIAAGLETAVRGFPKSTAARKVLVLISDGESLEGNPITAARECRNQDISLLVIAAGSEEGIILYDSKGEPVKDEDGRAVVTRMNREALQDVADAASGSFYTLSDPRTAGFVLEELDSLRKSGQSEGIRFQNQVNYRFFLIFALASLMLNLFLSQIRWSKWY